jgi:hypothetical protein
MRNSLISIGLFAFVLAASAQDTEDVKSALRPLSESSLLTESIAAEQAAVEGRRTGAGLEFRPGYTEDEGTVAFRFYLPDSWSKSRLREQLRLTAQSEELRIAALEWKELTAVYRQFCTFRMLRDQSAQLTAEIDRLAPCLEQINRSVQQHQFSVTDRAKLYGDYLDLINRHEKTDAEQLALRRQLYQVLGSDADLDALADAARIAPLPRLPLDDGLRLAQECRADLRQLDTQAQALGSAAALAAAGDGFRLKHIQTDYKMDLTGDDPDQWGVSAAFSLWGNRNPDVSTCRQQQLLAVSTLALQRRVIKARLQALLTAADEFDVKMARRNRTVQPMLDQLTADLQCMSDSPLHLRDRMTIRGQILDTTLETARMECEREILAIDLAEELGTLGE